MWGERPVDLLTYVCLFVCSAAGAYNKPPREVAVFFVFDGFALCYEYAGLW